MKFNILTIFPEFFNSPLQEGIIRRARSREQITTNIVNIRDFATDQHAMTDDRPYGGGEGMVMKPEPLTEAVRECEIYDGQGKVILLCPQGRQYTQRVAEELAMEEHLILVCGRYEGVDERFREAVVDDEISIGDYILTGGELAALVIVDSVTRLLPGVLGCSDSANRDTFSRHLLKHPQYTRPREFNGATVPEVLLSGDHELIEEYRFVASVQRTLERRPELLQAVDFSEREKQILIKHNMQAVFTQTLKN